MGKLKFLFALMGAFLLSSICYSQTDDKAEMADTMRSNGRIYVVVAVVLVILIGLILYLIRVDRKISKMEKDK